MVDHVRRSRGEGGRRPTLNAYFNHVCAPDACRAVWDVRACGLTQKRSKKASLLAHQLYTTGISPTRCFPHTHLHYYETPPGGALNLWSFVRHVSVSTSSPLLPFSLLSVGRESLLPHLILSASFYPAQSRQIHKFRGGRQQMCPCRGWGREGG